MKTPTPIGLYYSLLDLTLTQQRIALGATETIGRRMMLMASGRLTQSEAASMLWEKPTAWAKGIDGASRAAKRRESAVDVTTALLRPVSRKANSNARRLRNKK